MSITLFLKLPRPNFEQIRVGNVWWNEILNRSFERCARTLLRTFSPLKFVSESCFCKPDFISMKSRWRKMRAGWRMVGRSGREQLGRENSVFHARERGSIFQKRAAVLFIRRTTSKLASGWAAHPNRSMEPRSSRSISEPLVKDTPRPSTCSLT